MPLLAPPNPYTATADRILNLPSEVAGVRARLGLTVAAQAKQIGVTKTTLTRLTPGSNPSQATILAALKWLSRN